MSSRWKQGLLALPSVAFSMLPKLACPACWPAYAGLLTSVGLGFLISTVYLLPLTIAFLVLALGATVFRARERHGYRPFLLGMVAAGGVLAGKFVWESSPAIYGSVGLLVMASLWNTWPRRGKSSQEATCPGCPTEGF
jgi:mercuric ion transport protein